MVEFWIEIEMDCEQEIFWKERKDLNIYPVNPNCFQMDRLSSVIIEKTAARE